MLGRCLNDLLLGTVVKIFDNALPGVFAGRQLQDFVAPFEVVTEELVSFHGEVVCHQLFGFLEVFQADAGVFIHHMDLNHLLAIVMLKRLIVCLVVLLLPLSRQSEGHGASEHCKTILQHDGVLLMQVEQCPLCPFEQPLLLAACLPLVHELNHIHVFSQVFDQLLQGK